MNTRLHWVLKLTTVGVPLAAMVGCGGGFDATVTGTAKLNQSPLPRGTVNFIPQQAGPTGYGIIGTDGSYSIVTGRTKGLPAGQYVVTVASNELSVPDKNPGAPPKPGNPITPAWYRDAGKSPLKFTVSPGKNTIDLDLSSQPPAGVNAKGKL